MKIKKLIAVLLTAGFLATSVSPAFAENDNITQAETDNTDIYIKSATVNNGKTFVALSKVEDAVVIAAKFSDNRLVEIKSAKVDKGKTVVVDGIEATDIYVWDTMNNAMPLCEPFKIKKNEETSNSVRLKGRVTANSITNLDCYKHIDTSKDSEVTILLTDNYNTDNNDFSEVGYYYKFKVGNTDIESLLGQSVIFDVVKNETDNSYEILSVSAEKTKNDKIEFALDKFESADTDYIEYQKEDGESVASFAVQQEDLVVIYNNVAGVFDYDELFMSNFIEKDCLADGKVTAYDTDDVDGYDLIFVEIAATGVVDEVVNGKITFKNTPGLAKYANAISKIVVDEDDDDVIVNITKDGKEISVDEINEWDVLSIVTAVLCANDVYNIEVLSDKSVIEGSISDVSYSLISYTGEAYKINGLNYPVAEGAYCDNLNVGDSGKFYINAYGKIVAYISDDNSTDDSVYNYAYVLQVAAEEDVLGNGNVIVKLLTAKEGIVIWDLAEIVRIDDEMYKTEEEYNKIADIIKKNDVISYILSDGCVKTITTPDYSEKEEGYSQVSLYDYKYSEKNLTFGGKDVDDTTKVFIVNLDNANASTVTKISALEDGKTYENAKAFVDSDECDVLSLLVIIN